MYTIVSNVDRNIGNYEDVFIFTLNASFSGINSNTKDTEIRIFIPDYLTLYLGDIKEHVKEIREEIVENGKNVIFDFGVMEEQGVSVRLGFGIVFNNLALSGQQFNLVSQIYLDNVLETEDISEEIKLEVIPRFEISREIVLPLAKPSSGSEVYFKLTLENFGDLGKEVNNIKIICNGNDELVIDETFPVIGKDVSNKFKDKSMDDVEGVFNSNSVEFILSSYKGQRYEFIYKGKIRQTAEVGAEITTLANWSIEDIDQEIDVNTIELSDKIYSALAPIYGPEYTIPNEYIGYEFNIKNTGNQPLNNVSVEEVLSNKISYYEFKTGIFHVSGINAPINAEYSIEYTTIKGETDVLGPFNTNIDTTVSLQMLLDNNDNIRTLKWKLSQLSVGVESKIPPRIEGTVKEDTSYDSSIINQLEFKYVLDGEEIEIPNSKSTIVQNTCYLNTTFNQPLNNIPINPGTILKYEIGANCRYSRLSNPIIAFYLPKELEFLDNSVLTYTDNSKDSLTPKLPNPIIIENITEEGDRIVKYEFKEEFEFNFRQKSNFKISFDTKVKIGATGEFKTFTILNTLNAIEFIPDDSDIYRDTKNIAEDEKVSNIYAKSFEAGNRILFYVSTKSNKKVKGNLDVEYLEEPEVGTVTEGGNIEYKIDVTNIGNVPLEKVEIIDILPHIEDTSVLFKNIKRESEFKIYAISEVKAKVIDLDGNDKEALFDIYYSKSNDPVRFGPKFNIIGTDNDWDKKSPENLAELNSFKVVSKDTLLKPNETLEVTIILIAPSNVPLNYIAWNSFAADTVYKDIEGNEVYTLAIEPEKVGIEIKNNPEGKGKISGFVWFDNNKNGMPDIDEEKINNISVFLLDETDKVVNFTFSNPDFNGNNGYYSFNNIDYGKYRLFYLIPNKYTFTIKILDEIMGNKVNSKTGLTDEVTLNENNKELIINAGVIDQPVITIEKLLEVNNKVNKTFKNVIRNQLLITMKLEDVKKLSK